MSRTERYIATRRALLQSGLACSLVPGASFLRAAEPPPEDRMLVLLHLSGGNDGLNTIIPHADPLYHELRPRLSTVARGAIRIDEEAAFHPALTGIARLFHCGQLAIVQGVGYPEPDYSHRGSCRAWACGGRQPEAGKSAASGWWDCVVESISDGASRPVVSVPGRPAADVISPRLLRPAGGRQSSRVRNPLEYVPGAIEGTLTTAARVLRSSHPPRVVVATVGGFDTHTDQLVSHERVLRDLDGALCAFQAELDATGLADRVLVMAWSEFGRRIAENVTGGTDHGTAGPVFVLGKRIRGGLYGRVPSLQITDFGNLVPSVHVQNVYQSLAGEWLGCGGSADDAADGLLSLPLA